MAREGAGQVLLQERDPALRRILALSLKHNGLTIHEAVDCEHAAGFIGQRIDAVVLEYDPLSACGQLIAMLRHRSQPLRPPAVLVTTTRRPGATWRREHRPDLVLYKPFDIRFFEKKLLEALDDRQGSEEETVAGI